MASGSGKYKRINKLRGNSAAKKRRKGKSDTSWMDFAFDF